MVLDSLKPSCHFKTECPVIRAHNPVSLMCEQMYVRPTVHGGHCCKGPQSSKFDVVRVHDPV